MIAAIPVKLVDEGYDWPAWIAVGATLLTTLIVLATAIFAYFSLQDAKRTRHGQLVTELMRAWTEPGFVEAIALYAEYSQREGVASLVEAIFDPDSPKPPDQKLVEDWGKLSRIANLIESMGVLVEARSITALLVYEMWGGPILSAWPRWEGAVTKLRKYDQERDVFRHFEDLASEMRRISDERKAAQKAGSTSASSDLQGPAEAEPGKDVQRSSVPPLVSHSNRSFTRWGVVLTTVVALSALYGWLRRRASA